MAAVASERLEFLLVWEGLLWLYEINLFMSSGDFSTIKWLRPDCKCGVFVLFHFYYLDFLLEPNSHLFYADSVNSGKTSGFAATYLGLHCFYALFMVRLAI